MERKAGNGTKPFTRLIVRPETSVAAGAAADRAPVERVISSGPAPAVPLYGKIYNGDDVGYTPNRFQKIINNVWENSPVLWLERTGKIGLWMFIALICAIISALLWGFGGEVFRSQKFRRVATLEQKESLAPDSVRQAAVRRAFDAFLAAPDPAGKLPWVLEPQRVESRMKDFYLVRQQKDPAVASFEVSAPLRAGNEWWFTLSCQTRGGLTQVLVKETPSGGQLDWENFVAYGSMSWQEFQSRHPAAPQSMRVRLRPSQNYAGKYQTGDYLSYEITHRESGAVLHAYVTRASRAGQLLAALPQTGDWQAANLYLHWESDAGAPGCVVIADLIRNNWLDAISTAKSSPPVPAPAP